MIEPEKQNMSSLLEKRLPKGIFSLLKEVGKFASERNTSAFVVGGFVRDMILNQKNLDIDVVVEGEGDGVDFARQFAVKLHLNSEVVAHDRFGTTTVKFEKFDKFEGASKIDFATSRHEIYPHSGSLPVVQKGAIKDDLYRRDFTINAIAVNLNNEQFGDLFDPFNGVDDIHSRTLKVMHNMSFIHDPTRILRGVRFESRYNFHFEPYTQSLLKAAISSDVISNISGQRLKNELVLILKEADPAKPLSQLWKLGVFRYIHPNLFWSDDMPSKLAELERWHTWRGKNIPLETMDLTLIRLISLFNKLEMEHIHQLSDKLGLDGKTLKALKDAKSLLSSSGMLSEPIPSSQIYRMLNAKNSEAILFIAANFENEVLRSNITNYLLKIRHINPLIDGNLLKDLGYSPGPIYSQILAETFNAQLDGKILHQSQAISFIKKRFNY